MTKAEATVYNSPLWTHVQNRTEDHKSLADTVVNIYERSDDGPTTHRLCCYSSHGDSILWVKEDAVITAVYGSVWKWYRDSSIRDGNIEHEYDRILPPLV